MVAGNTIIKSCFYILMLSCTCMESLGQLKKRALFLGNSYTGVNNLPLLISKLATSTGDTLLFDSNVPGGYTFQAHSSNQTTLNKISVGNWDFVSLQEQSQLPSFSENDVQSQVFPYAHYLDSVINARNSCCETIFYMTWGRKNGDASNCASWPPVCSYSGMDSLLYERYMQMATDNNAIVSPVGAVWKYIRQVYPSIELYQADQSHPSIAGSYAAACCFYTVIFRKDPLDISFDNGLSASVAADIRRAVKNILYNDLQKWKVGKYDAAADFNFSPGQTNQIQFTNSSLNATNYIWQFGDGTSSFEAAPLHNYATAGTYLVKLTATNCSTDSNLVREVVITEQPGTVLPDEIVIFPNPVISKLEIKFPDLNAEKVQLINSIGQTVYSAKIIREQRMIIDCSSLPSGVYFVKVLKAATSATYKIIKF